MLLGGEQAERAVARRSLAFFVGCDAVDEVVMTMVSSGRQLTPIKIVRLARGVPQIVLATEAGISVSRLSQIECGWRQPTPDELLRLAGVLEVEIEQLQGERAA